MIKITKLYMICDPEISVMQSATLNVVARNQQGSGYVPGRSSSTQFVSESTKRQKGLQEEYDEQDAD